MQFYSAKRCPCFAKKVFSLNKKSTKQNGENSFHALSGLTPLPWIHFGFLSVVMVTPGTGSHDEHWMTAAEARAAWNEVFSKETE